MEKYIISHSSVCKNIHIVEQLTVNAATMGYIVT